MIAKAVVLGAAFLVGSCFLVPLATAGGEAEQCQTAPVDDGIALDVEQRSNVATIVAIGQRFGVGRGGQVIGVMTAMTESTLRNLDHGDAAGPDSRGLFQQRAPWGPLAVRMDPAGASELFFKALLDLPGWATKQPWVAAQAVQRSAFPDGQNYRRNYDLAARIVQAAPASCGGWQVIDSADLPGAQAAVTRAMSLVGQTGYYQLCARLAANIWGRPRAGYFSAADQWSSMVGAGQAHQGDRRPPVGALIFWATSGPYGHVAVYVGGGRIVSNDISDRSPGLGGVYLVELGSIESKWNARYLGWAPPVYPAA